MANGNFAGISAALILLSGLPGSGKTTFAHRLRGRLAFDHIESDAIRAAIAPQPTFSMAESGAVFARVEREARRSLAEGRHALIDATNLTNRDRKRFLRLAREMGAPLVCVRLTAPAETIRARLAGPREGFSNAGIEVYERMHSRPQPMPVPVIVVDTRSALEPAIELVVRLACGEEPAWTEAPSN